MQEHTHREEGDTAVGPDDATTSSTTEHPAETRDDDTVDLLRSDAAEEPDAFDPVTEPGPPGPVLQARGVTVSGVVGPVVTGLDVDLPRGGVCVLQGPDNAGKTSALLTLAGRMPFRVGAVEVDGFALPRKRGAVQKRVALAEMRGINDLDAGLTISAHIAERLATRTLMPWARSRDVRAVVDRYTSALEAARALRPQTSPRPDVAADWFVGDLTGLERELLGVVLALIGDPAVVVVDENGDLRSRDDQLGFAAALGYLLRTAATPFSLLGAVTDPVDDERLAQVFGLDVGLVSVVRLVPTAPDARRSEGDVDPTAEDTEPAEVIA